MLYLFNEPGFNIHQAQNNCPSHCLGSAFFERATAAFTQYHRSRHHRTSRCILLHHPVIPLADFGILHWLPPFAEAIAVEYCTILLILNHSSLPGRDQQQNFSHRLAALTLIDTHHHAHFIWHCRLSSYLLLVCL